VAVPVMIEHLTGPWASLYNNSKTLVMVVTFSHFAGLLLGGGAAVAADRAALRLSGSDEDAQRRHLGELRATHRIVLVGLSITLLSGFLMLAADVGTFLGSRVFWMKMALVAALLVNGALIVRAEGRARVEPAAGWRWLRATALVSLVLWFVTVFVGTAMATLG
jgi:hypothetical protein